MLEASDIPDKQILVEFVGGDADGLTVDNQSGSDDDKTLVEGIFLMTDGGKIGKFFQGVSVGRFFRIAAGENVPGFSRGHCFTVVEKIDEPERLIIRLQYSVRQPNE